MLGAMEITQFGPEDHAEVREFVRITNAARRVDTPWDHELTEREADGMLRHGWDLEPPTPFLATVDGVGVGVVEYETSGYDNFQLAWLTLWVHPEHRRQGHGSALLEAMTQRARDEGRTMLGTTGWDSTSSRGFAGARGFDQKAIEVVRRQHIARLDVAALDAAYDEALPHAEGYDLVRWLGPVPDDEIEAVARMAAAINDAPTDDMEIEDEAYPPERIRAYETAQAAQGTLHRVFARHRATGEFAGQTVISVDGERPRWAEQHDTSVVATHRGHRLGLLLKLEMLRWLRETQPQLEMIDTWNAESNDHMIEVNELLGFEVVGRALVFQRPI